MSVAVSEQKVAGPVKVNIQSEYGVLKTVLVHKPGEEIDRLTPYNLQSLLFEDIPFLPRMMEEHDNFVKTMQDEGIRVLYLEELLLDILQDKSTQMRLVTLSCDAFSMPSLANIILKNYRSPEEVRDILFRGLTVGELDEKGTVVRSGLPDQRYDQFLLKPIPNAYFSRDPAAAIGNYIVSCKTHYDARVRETLMVKEVFRKHPLFSENPGFIYGDAEDEDRPYTVEGGDIIVLKNKVVAVGRSERTRAAAIHKLTKKLFNEGLADRVYEIAIPAERIYMHLDTVFTVVDEGLVVAYPKVMDEVQEIKRHEPIVKPFSNEIEVFSFQENRTFNKVLEDEFGRLKVIKTGNNDLRYAAREQRADGTNVFAIAPSKVITYDRNTYTNQALVAELGVGNVVLIPGSELVRGLGGPRCMTMPLQREG
jgi:arginine deiminase